LFLDRRSGWPQGREINLIRRAPWLAGSKPEN
jgi:hypothetical protein